MCRGLSGGRTLSFEGRCGGAPGERVDDQCLVPLGCPGRHPGDTPRPLVDQVDAGDHRPVAQAHASLLEPAFGLMSETGPTEGPNLLLPIPNPVAKRCSMNDASGYPTAVAARPAWGCRRV